MDETNIKKLIPKRDPNGHKGTFGSALLVTGSFSMAGAAILSAAAANKCGCGLVKHALPKSIYNIVASNVVESVYYPFDDSKNGNIDKMFVHDIISLINTSNSALIGCGLKNTVETEKLVKQAIINSTVPLILDADGINSIADSIDILKKSKAPILLTPHVKEFSRISGLSIKEILSDTKKIAAEFSTEYNCYLVLKGHNSLICAPDGRLCVNSTGNSGMAKGGSGDVLSGIAVSLLAQGINVFDAACLGVYIHGLAGDIASNKYTEFAMTASDIINSLGEAFQKLI